MQLKGKTGLRSGVRLLKNNSLFCSKTVILPYFVAYFVPLKYLITNYLTVTGTKKQNFSFNNTGRKINNNKNTVNNKKQGIYIFYVRNTVAI